MADRNRTISDPGRGEDENIRGIADEGDDEFEDTDDLDDAEEADEEEGTL
jgi:hypothetical protein